MVPFAGWEMPVQYEGIRPEHGGVLDDLFSYRFDGDERFLTVVNAANAASDYAWFAGRADGWNEVAVSDRSADYAMLALQGPRAIDILEQHLEGVEPPRRFRFTEGRVAGRQALVCRTGYTGEDGVELLLSPDDAVPVWDA